MEAGINQARIDAREALLDAVDALGSHSDAGVLVGAQAVYAHSESEDASFSVSPFTYDADIVLDPELLRDTPPIVDVMECAGFRLGDQPGLYSKGGPYRVDLLVPEAVGGPGRRGARLGAHGTRAAMKVRGLEGALVSHERKTISSLAPGAGRSCNLKVAGPAALLVAKVHKVGERVGEHESPRNRQLDKDAFDIYRLLRAIDTADMVSELRLLKSHEVSRQVTSDALSMFQKLFCDPTDAGTQLVVRHVANPQNDDFIAGSSVALSQDLISAVAES